MVNTPTTARLKHELPLIEKHYRLSENRYRFHGKELTVKGSVTLKDCKDVETYVGECLPYLGHCYISPLYQNYQGEWYGGKLKSIVTRKTLTSFPIFLERNQK